MRYTNTSDNRKFGGFCEEKIDSLVRQETCSLSLLLLFPLLHLQTESLPRRLEWSKVGCAYLTRSRQVLRGRVVRLAVTWQRWFWCRDVHAMPRTHFCLRDKGKLGGLNFSNNNNVLNTVGHVQVNKEN